MTITLDDAQELYRFVREHSPGRRPTRAVTVAYQVLRDVEQEYVLVCSKCARRASWLSVELFAGVPFCPVCSGRCGEYDVDS